MWRTTRNFSKIYAEIVRAFLASRQRNEKDSIAQRPLSPGPSLAVDTRMRRKKPSCSNDKMYSVCQYLSVYARPIIKDTCVLEGTTGPQHPCLAILTHTCERGTLAYVPVLLETKAWGFLDIVFVVAKKKMGFVIHRFTCHPCGPLHLGQTWIWGRNVDPRPAGLLF